MDGFNFFPANTQPSQTSATGLGHTSAPRAGLEAAAVEAETACRHGLPTVEARRPVQVAADGGARRSLRLVVIVHAHPRRTVAARARVVAGVAVQQGVPGHPQHSTAAPKGWAEHNSHTEATAEHRSIGSCRKRN